MEECSIIYIWTAKVPASKNIAECITHSNLADVVTLVCADSPDVRNHLLYGKTPTSIAPGFVVIRNGVYEFYPPARTSRALQIAKQLLREISSSAYGQTIDGFGIVSSHDASKISRIESDDEEGLLRSSKV